MRLFIPFVLASAALSFATPVAAAPKGCPPGLAKKATPCVPPGQAKKGGYEGKRYNRGDIVQGDYIIIRNPDRYGLGRDGTYYRVGDNVFRVDRETHEVLEFLGAAAALLD
ncbi:excinuclease ABC subunit A [uncultured Roseobacter sp.]|uniref:excinuclease ABC subunit A n=1 Tax=uncultured Roseobacter sp. TaxID=114847 RepID=UPI00261E4A25|nr:excinuclease ABC subunit A [uncultured Roseobacter sp.]